MTLKIVFLLALIFAISSAQTLSTDYYIGFIEALGIDTHINDDGVDCSVAVSDALFEFKATLLEDYNDADLLLESVLDIIDRLKYEVSPTCRTIYGDFRVFLSTYYGDARELVNKAEANLDLHHLPVGAEIKEAIDSMNLGDEYEAGRAHAKALRILIGLSGDRQDDDFYAFANLNQTSNSNQSVSVQDIDLTDTDELGLLDDEDFE